MVMTSLRPRVLVVSESEHDRNGYARALQSHGFCTLQAATADDACRLAAELPPSAAVISVKLAGPEDGLTLSRRIKADDRTRQMPVVVLTTNVLVDDREAVARARCDLVLPAACQPEVLSSTVAGLIQRTRGKGSAAVNSSN